MDMNTNKKVCSTCGTIHTLEVLATVDFPELETSMDVAKIEDGTVTIRTRYASGDTLVAGHWDHFNDALKYAEGYPARCAEQMALYLAPGGSF